MPPKVRFVLIIERRRPLSCRPHRRTSVGDCVSFRYGCTSKTILRRPSTICSLRCEVCMACALLHGVACRISLVYILLTILLIEYVRIVCRPRRENNPHVYNGDQVLKRTQNGSCELLVLLRLCPECHSLLPVMHPATCQPYIFER